MKHADEYVGGIPPSSIGVKHKKDLLNPFLNSLLGDEKLLKEKEVLLFGCSYLRWYEKLKDVILCEPLGRYDTYKKHPVIAKTLATAGNYGVSEEDLLIWSRQITDDFVSKNCLALPLSVIDKVASEDQRQNIHSALVVDTRPMITAVNDMATATRFTAMNVLKMESCIQMLATKTSQIISTLERMKKIDMLEDKIEGKVSEIKETHQKENYFKHIDDWSVIEQRFNQNMKHLVYNWYNYYPEKSFQSIKDQNVKKRHQSRSVRF